MPISPGETIGPYRVLEQLGSGGMATVFKAYHAALDRYIAIKILHPAFKANPQFFERFQREARIVAGLEHPHIIPVYDFNEHHGEPYLVMRYVEGDTLKARMTGDPMPAVEVLHLVRPVCRALAYAHGKGVLHRDIKPSNVMVAQDGSIFLTDFGLARMVQAGESTLSQDMMVGTPQYISPEQAQGISQLDGRTDIYSLGVVLFEMLTGRVPFTADTPFATVHDHIYTPLPLPSTINPEIDPAVERVLLKALSKEPADRFPAAEALLDALESTLSAQIVAPTPAVKPAPAAPSAKTTVGKANRSQRPWWVWAGGAAAVLLVCAGLLAGALWWRRSNRLPAPAPQPPPAGQADSPQPGPAADLAHEAGAAMQRRQYDRAAELYHQAIAADPHYLPAYFGLSEAQRQAGDVPGSIVTLEQAAANNPGNPLPLQRLGETYLIEDRPVDALPLFEEAAALAPSNPTLSAEQAIALLALDRDDEAKQAIDTALALDQFSPEARLAHAMYLAKQRQLREAAQILRQLAQDARVPLFVQNRARLLLERLPKP
jgi:tetratricopeptide (TPR) repeat protein